MVLRTSPDSSPSDKAGGRRVRAAPKGAPAEEGGAPAIRRDLLAAEVLDKAAVLFASKGFAATSLKDIADAVGLRRSSIYYYFPNKDALLRELIQGVTLPVIQMLQQVGAEDLPPLAKIGEVVRRLVLWVGDPKKHFRLLDGSEAQLPAAVAKLHTYAKRTVLKEMTALIEAAVLAGEARAGDARVSALSLIGMAMWTAWWFQPGQGAPLAEVADRMAENAVALVRRTAPGSGTAATLGDLTREIRQNLDLIDRIAAGPGRPDPAR